MEPVALLDRAVDGDAGLALDSGRLERAKVDVGGEIGLAGSVKGVDEVVVLDTAEGADGDGVGRAVVDKEERTAACGMLLGRNDVGGELLGDVPCLGADFNLGADGKGVVAGMCFGNDAGGDSGFF